METPNKPFTIFLFAFMCISMSYGYWLGIQQEKMLNANPGYTVGIINDMSVYRGRSSLIYECEVGTIVYQQAKGVNDTRGYYIGDKYRVKYAIQDPNISELLLDEPVSE